MKSKTTTIFRAVIPKSHSSINRSNHPTLGLCLFGAGIFLIGYLALMGSQSGQ